MKNKFAATPKTIATSIMIALLGADQTYSGIRRADTVGPNAAEANHGTFAFCSRASANALRPVGNGIASSATVASAIWRPPE